MIFSRDSFIQFRIQENQLHRQYVNNDGYQRRLEEDIDDDDDDLPPGLEMDQSPKKNQISQRNSQFNDHDFNSEFADRERQDQKNKSNNLNPNQDSLKKEKKAQENNSLEIASGQKQNKLESEQEMLNKVFLEFCDDPQTYYDYPSAQHFMDLILTREKNQEDKRSKKEEDKKLLEEYLNRLFIEKNGDTYKETLDNEREASDEETIKKLIDKFKKEQDSLSVSIKRVDTERWNVDLLKQELRLQYKNQGEQFKRIIDLFYDKLGLKGIIKEKDKKIVEIQRVLEELNHKKVIYLDLKNEKKEDLTFNYVKKTRDEEISKLKENEIRLNKELIIYKTKYETYHSKYKEIMEEAKIAQKEIQSLMNQILHERKQVSMVKEEEELKRQTAEKENKIKTKQTQNKYSLNNTMITSQIISPLQQNIEDIHQGFDKSSFPFYNENGKHPGTSQLIQPFSANKKPTPPNTPPQKTNQILLSPNISLKSNQTYNEQQQNNNQNQNQFSQNNQEQGNKRLLSFDLNNEEQPSFLNQQQLQQQQQQNQQTQQYQQQQTQQQQQQQQQQNLPDKQQQQSATDYQKQTYSNLNPSLLDNKISSTSQFENKKQKVNFQIKTKEEEEEYYYKQLCASKIKFMVESIQNSNILQKSIQNKKR
ncbi:hypothetical protein ABPG74_011186 [Tetrahymena malaccensis]